nr:salivary glue protein Sgs-3-like [Ipomoea batatas]
MPITDTARETEVALEEDITYDFWSEAVEVAAMFDSVPDVELGVQQEEITITQPQMDFDNTQAEIGQQVTKSTPKVTKASKTFKTSSVQPRRRYGTRSTVKPRFTNTIDTVVNIN